MEEPAGKENVKQSDENRVVTGGGGGVGGSAGTI